MNKIKNYFIIVTISLCLVGISSCKGKSDQKGESKSTKAATQTELRTTLFDKSLPEIKKLVNGKWELLSGQNPSQLCEFENTFIIFNDDKYIWSEDGNDEPGDLNWRKADTGLGYESYMMDVFYATNPAFPLSINGDTLFIQDCSETKYKYTLVKR